MKERPILFSGPMVRAILDGRKTQTRRVIRPQPVYKRGWFHWATSKRSIDFRLGNDIAEQAFAAWCPHGMRGDRLWVRETFAGRKGFPLGQGKLFYRADGDVTGRQEPLSYYEREDRWRPSIHMSRWACRLILDVKAVRVERLLDITCADLRAEGMNNKYIHDNLTDYRKLWDSLNKKRGFGWDTNPFVWVIEFERTGTERTQ